MDNESPHWGDLTGDWRPELVCNRGGYFGYAQPDEKNTTAPWIFHAISPKGAWGNFTNGLGAGDVNGDGRNDIVTSLVAHGFGLAWFEQVREDGEITFRQRMIMNKQPAENRHGVHFSMLHAVTLADMDGDGLKDIETGNRFWLPGYRRDTEPGSPSPLYWFKLSRRGAEVDFIPHRIDGTAGLGVQLVAADLNGDQRLDVIMANKQGTFVFMQQARTVSREEWEQAQPKPKPFKPEVP